MMPEKNALRFSVIEPSGNLYGSEYCLLDILKGLPKEDYRPTVFLPKGGAFAQRLTENGVRKKCILVPRSNEAPILKKVMAYMRVAFSHLHRQFQLVYINQAGIIRPMAVMNRFFKCPIVCQVQTLEDAIWVGKNPGVHSQINAFICNSDFIATRTNVPKDRKSVVYYGYLPKGLRRQRPKFDPERIVVGLLGRIGGSKGHDLVLDAASILKGNQEKRFVFRFIGEAPTKSEAQWWRDEVARRGLDDLIEFRGYRENISSELAELHMMVIPSRMEPFGRILCEAAEAEVPVIVSNSGGLGELSRRFGFGMRHEAMDVSDFVDCLNAAVKNYEDFRESCSEAGERMLEKLSYEAYIQKIESVLDLCAKGRKTSINWYGLDSI